MLLYLVEYMGFIGQYMNLHLKPKMKVLAAFSGYIMMHVLSAQTQASENNLLSIGLGQSETDYFGDNASPITSNSQSVSFLHQFSDVWQLELNYEKIDGDGRWLNADSIAIDRFNQAETTSDTIGFSVLWQQDDIGLNFSYSEVSTDDRSNTFFPAILESVSSDDKIISFSFNHSILFDESVGGNIWNFDWSLGTQYAEFDVAIHDIIVVEPLVNVDTLIEQSNLSGYVDLNISYWIEEPGFYWSPYFSLSWNKEFSSNGEQLILISRGEQRQLIDEPSSRFSSSFRTPDSGSWNMGVSVFWQSGWSIDIGYGETLATEIELQNLAVNLSVSF